MIHNVHFIGMTSEHDRNKNRCLSLGDVVALKLDTCFGMFYWDEIRPQEKMCRVIRKSVFGVSDQFRHKPGYTTTEMAEGLEFLDLERRGIGPTM